MLKSGLARGPRRASAWPLFGLSLLSLITVGAAAHAAPAPVVAPPPAGEPAGFGAFRIGGGLPHALSSPMPGRTAGASSSAGATIVLPTGGVVVAGTASIGSRSVNALIIDQSSGKAIIDWGGFSIGSGGTVRFDNGAGATLNRVTGQSLSSIDGLLSATGSVYLINPNGVIVGKGGVVNVGGSFVASTLDVANANFLGGGPLTFAGPSTASVVNLGKVGALGGDVALIAQTVSNAGSISAPNGAAGLISGGQVLMSDAGLDGGRFSVVLPAAGGSVTNSGLIEAATAELRANGGSVYALAGDTAGVIRATGVAAGGGKIWLVAEGGTARVAGTLDAQSAGGAPGQVETSGETVQVGAANIDAHGGTWTLDPTDLTIDATAATTISNALATSDVVEQTTATTASGTGTQAAGAGDITLAGGAAINWGSTHALTLSAYHDVNLAGTISLTGAGALTLRADNTGTGAGTIHVSGAASQVTLATGATANLFYNPVSYTDTATRSTQQNQGSPSGDFNNTTNPYTNPYNASNPGQTLAASAPVMGGTVRAYMLVNSLAQLGGGLTGIGSQLNGLYALNTDIDASSTATANPVPGMSGTFYGFIPVGYTGNQTNSFTGVFDGQGHTLSNLYINHFTLDSNGNRQNQDNAGLFGVVGGNSAAVAIVRNLNVVNASVIGSGLQSGIVAGDFQGGSSVGSNLVTSGTVTGNRSGGVAGDLFAGGTVQNSHSSATITNGFQLGGLVGASVGGLISNSSATGAVTGSGSVGGLVGYSPGGVLNSYATGNVSGTDHVGGLAGQLGTSNNVYATGTVTSTGGGDERVGGVAGELISGSTLTNAYATGAVTAQGDNVGGLIGFANGSTVVIDAYASGAVTAAGSHVGGLVGINDGSVSQSYASGAVSGSGDVGGLVGFNSFFPAPSSITDSYATGSVTGAKSSDNSVVNHIGGLVGTNNHYPDVNNPSQGSITRSYATGLVGGVGTLGGLVGGNSGAITNALWDRTSTGQANGVGATLLISGTDTSKLTNLTSVQDTDPTSRKDYAYFSVPYINAGFGFDTTPGGTTANPWVQVEPYGRFNEFAQPGTRPILLMEYSTTIVNAHQLQLIQLAPTVNYTLARSIDASGTNSAADVWGPAGFLPLGPTAATGSTPYTGTFDGQGFNIIGLTIKNVNGGDTGLFADVQGLVQSVNLVGGSVSYLGRGGDYVGALIGSVLGGGSVSNATSSASVSGPNANATGGLVGRNLGPITNSSAAGAVSGGGATGGLVGTGVGAITGSLATGSVTGTANGVGGLVGVLQNGVTISGSYATGNVSSDSFNVGGLVGEMARGSSVSNSYATGTVSSAATNRSPGIFSLPSVGGLVGLVDPSASVTKSYATGTVSGTQGIGGLVGSNYGAISDSRAVGNVSGAQGVGGLVGANLGSILGTITGVTGTTFATGAVMGTAGNAGNGTFVGGLVGINAGNFNTGQGIIASIVGAFATGAVSGTSGVGGLVGANVTATSTNNGTVMIAPSAISNSFATGAVSGSGSIVGGLVGDNGSGSTITDSYATGSVLGVNRVGGLTGTNDADTTSNPGTTYLGSVTGSAAGKTYASGAVTGTGTATGGLVGENQGTITLAAYVPTGAGVAGVANVGGLVGQNDAQASIMTGSSAAMVSGTTNVGGLVGLNQGGTVIDSYETGSVGGVNGVGGLVGANLNDTTTKPGTTYKATITDSGQGLAPNTFALGAVTGTGKGAGGIAGENSGTISALYTPSNGKGLSGAADVGGLVGLNDPGGTVSGSATGPVSGTSYTGGLIGDNFGTLTGGSYGRYAVNPFNNVQSVTGLAGVGGIVGVNEGGGTIASATVGGGARGGVAVPITVTGTGNDVGGIAGANFGTLTTVGGIATTVTGVDHVGGLVGFNLGTVTGAADGMVNGHDAVGGQIGFNFGAFTLSGAGLGFSAPLTNPAGNETVGGRNYVGGLIGWNDTSGTLANGVSPATVSASGDYVGGVVGVNKGTLTGVRATGGSVAGARIVGGLVGLNQGSISSSAATGAVTGDQAIGGLVGWNDTAGTISRSYSTGKVTGRVGGEDATTRDDYVGGLIGVNFGSASDVYATGVVSGVQVVGGLVGTNMPGGASITRAYSTGAVSATRGAVGGLAGVQAGTLTSTYFQPSASGQASGAGYTTANATGAPTAIGPGVTCAPGASCDPNAAATYQGFDFTNTWQANTGSPPTLKGVTQ